MTFSPLADELDPSSAVLRGRPYHAEIPLTTFKSEQQMADCVLSRLQRSFYIDREVTGEHCSGRRLRIDAIIRPRQPDLWRNSDVALGIEFKLIPSQTDLNDYTRSIGQAVSYTHVDWPGYGRLLIMACPGAGSWLAGGGAEDRQVQMARHIAGQLGVGELVLHWACGLTLLFNDGHIWSERYGVSAGKNWSLRSKVGHR